MGGGCDYSWPEGLQGDPITHNLNNFNDYVKFHQEKDCISCNTMEEHHQELGIDVKIIKVGGNSTDYRYTLANPIIASSGQIR